MPPLPLPRTLDVASVTVLADDLRRAMTSGPITIDASAVTRVDAAGLQLLCAAAIFARGRGIELAWHGVPQVLAAGARTLALTEVLGWSHAEGAG